MSSDDTVAASTTAVPHDTPVKRHLIRFGHSCVMQYIEFTMSNFIFGGQNEIYAKPWQIYLTPFRDYDPTKHQGSKNLTVNTQFSFA